MFRFLFYPALALNFCVFGANAGERYGEWLLEQPRSSGVTLSFKQSAPRTTIAKIRTFVMMRLS